MELEEMEMIFKANTEQMEAQLAKVQPMVDKIMGKTAESAKAGMDKTEQSMDMSKGIQKIQDQLSKLNETVKGSFERVSSATSSGASKVSQSAGKMFTGSRAKVKQDFEAMLSEINAKMNQARAAQAKMRDLMSQKASLGTAQQNGTQGVKIDNQVASAQAQMTRYQNQAKALAQSMRREFDEVPSALKQISTAMDNNEVKIETYRRQLKNLQGSYRDVQDSMKTMGVSDKLTKQSTVLETKLMSTRDKMNKLINSNDSLNKSYAYVSDRGAELKSVIAKLNTEMGESGTAATRAASSYNRFGGAANSAMNKASGSGKGPSNWFSRISNGIQGATSRIRNFGNSSSSSMGKASSSAKRTSGALGGIVQQLKYLPSQLIVFGLLYQGLTQLASGMMTAFKTNAQFANSLNQIKVNLMTAFYPIYNFVLPAVNALMSSLSKATSWLAQFTSALTGMSYSKARQGAQGLYEQSKALNSTATASSKASASVKKANAEITKQNQAQARSVREANAEIRKQNQAQAASVREANRQIAESNREGAAKVRSANAAIEAANKKSQAAMEATKKKNKELMQSLMGFDELNVLDKSNDDDSTYDKKAKETFTPQAKQDSPESKPTQTAPESTPLQTSDGMGADDPNALDFGTPLGQSFDSAAGAAKRLQKILGELFDPMQAAWNAKGKKVTDAAKYAWREIQRALGDVGRSFLHVWDNGTGQKTTEAILQLLADMLNIIGDIGKAFSQAWEGGGGRGTRLIQTIFNSLNDVLKLIHDIATSFREAWNGGNLGERIFANLIKLATNVARIIGDIATAFDKAWTHGNTGTKLIQSILNMLNEVIKVLDNIAVAFRNAWNSGAGEKIASNLLKIFTNIFNTIGALANQFDKAWQHGGTGSAIFKTLLGMANDMLGALKDMSGATVTWASKLNFTPLLNSIDTLLKAIRPVVKDVWDGLDWGYKNILLPLAKFSITNLIPDFFNFLAAALKVAHSIIKAASPAFEWFYKDFIVPISKIAAIALTGALKLLTGALKLLSGWIDKHHKAVENITKVLITLFALKIAGSMLTKMKDFVDTLKILGMLKFDGLKAGAKHADDMLGVVIEFAKHPILNIKELAHLKFENIRAGGKHLSELWTQANKGWQSTALAKTDILKPLRSSVSSQEPMKLGQKLGTSLSVGMIAITSAIDIYKGIKEKNKTKKFENYGSGLGGAIGGGIGLWFGGPLGALIGQQIGTIIGKWGGDGAANFSNGWDAYGKGKKPDDWLGSVGFDTHEMVKSVSSDFNDLKQNVIAKSGDAYTSAQSSFEKLKNSASDSFGKAKAYASDKFEGLKSAISTRSKSAYTSAKSSFESLKKSASTNFNIAKQAASDKFGDLKSSISSKSKSAYTKAKKNFEDLKSTTSTNFEKARKSASDSFSDLKSAISSKSKSAYTKAKTNFENLKTSTASKFGSMKDTAKSKFESIRSTLTSKSSKAKDNVLDAWSTMKTKTSPYFSSIKSISKSAFDKVADGASGLGSRIGKGLASGWQAVKDGAAKLGNGIVSGIKGAVNGVLDGIRWILRHVGASSKAKEIGNWVPRFAKGGRHKGGPALVNDQPGAVFQEAYKLPNGKTGLFPKVRNMMVNLPQNTQIMPAMQVAQKVVPHYADGIGDFNFDLSDFKIDIPDISFDFGSIGSGLGDMFSGLGDFNLGNFNLGGLFDGVGSAVGGFVDSASDAIESLFDDFKHPERILKSAMQKFVKFTGLDGYPLEVAKSMVDFSVDNAKSFISGILKKYSTEAGGSLNNPGGSSVNRWRDYVRKGLAANGLSTSPAMIAKVLRQIQTESGGNPQARQPGADPDGDGSGPAMGLMQTKRATFDSNAFSGHHNIFNGYDSILAGLHYAKARYGSALGFLGQGHGYENGGLVTEHQLFQIGEGNKPEMVLPLTNVPRSMQLIQQALSFMGQTFSGGLQMPAALTQPMDMSSLETQQGQSNTSTQNINGGGINQLGSQIVNALVQGLQMANLGGTSQANTQPIDIHVDVNVAGEDFGNAAVKNINLVNQKNGKNMLKL